MGKIESKIVEQYQKIMAADPGSRVFAVLSDAYREMGLIEQAESMARRGVARHYTYAPGYVSLARILIHKGQSNEAIGLLKKAVEISPDNLLAFQLLGEAHLQNKNTKEALRSHKMALFLSPNNPRSRDVVKKLEALTAEEFDSDFFEMKPLAPPPAIENATSAQSALPQDLDRTLSVVDALIVRQQPLLAKERLQRLAQQFPGNAEVQSRWALLEIDEELESAERIKPLAPRELRILRGKIKKLEAVLNVLQKHELSRLPPM